MTARKDMFGAGLTGVPLIEQSPVLRDRVHETLEDLIVRRVLKPGERLLESDLAAQLGVSRNPLREAMTMLHRDGWIDIHPRTGAYVHEPSAKEIDDFFEMRALLESFATERAARSLDEADLLALDQSCEDGVNAARSGDVQGMAAANAAFHDRIVDRCGNTMLRDLLMMMRKRVQWYFASVPEPRSWDEHRQIIAAFRSGDTATAARMMHEHTIATAEKYRERSGAVDPPAGA
jgi:DNA-binding GntR family transcriptional regulator